jgi:hypothetical protein
LKIKEILQAERRMPIINKKYERIKYTGERKYIVEFSTL